MCLAVSRLVDVKHGPDHWKTSSVRLSCGMGKNKKVYCLPLRMHLRLPPPPPSPSPLTRLFFAAISVQTLLPSPRTSWAANGSDSNGSVTFTYGGLERPPFQHLPVPVTLLLLPHKPRSLGCHVTVLHFHQRHLYQPAMGMHPFSPLQNSSPLAPLSGIRLISLPAPDRLPLSQ